MGQLSRLVQVRLYQLYYERLAHLDVSPGAFGVLAIVWANPGIQHGELAQALAIRGPNLTKLVDLLVRRGWMERRKVKNDGRTAGHYLTAQARAKVQSVLAEGVAHDERMTASALSAGERKTLLKLLAKLARGLAASATVDGGGAFKRRTRRKRAS
ncbi:MAG: MarR family transcriptional regulator [Bradyrhizobiaceae bacterium]|nr:MarR family transcriptional regulator [Bradyrhizobiaceae bacterium]